MRKISAKNTNYYYLTIKPDDSVNAQNMREMFSGYNLTQIRPFEVGVDEKPSGGTPGSRGEGKGSNVARSASIGWARAIQAGLRDQDVSRPFQPFVVLEDDAALYTHDPAGEGLGGTRPDRLPEYFNIPDDADIVYMGICEWGMVNGEACDSIIVEDYNSELARIYNSLALTAVMYCSPLGASAVQSAMVDSFYQKKVHDVFAAEIQKHYKVYCYKIPFFYQKFELGGVESVTRRDMGSLKLFDTSTLGNLSRFFENSAIRRITTDPDS